MTTATAGGMSILSYAGAKHRVAIIADLDRHYPNHKIYIETCGGTLGYLCAKAERSEWEIVSDKNPMLVTLYQTVQNPTLRREVVRRLKATRFCKASQDTAKELLASFRQHYACLPVKPGSKSPPYKAIFPRASAANIDPTALVWAILVTNCLNNHSLDVTFRNIGSITFCEARYASWKRLPNRVKRFGNRLEGVTIESLDCLDLLRKYDHKDTFFQIDPPYIAAEQTQYLYAAEMPLTQHTKLVEAADNASGKIMIWNSDNEIYREALIPPRWRRFKRQTITALRTGGKPKKWVERFWINY